MARSPSRLLKSSPGESWLPRPGRRAVIAGMSAGSASLLLGCASDGSGGARGGLGGNSGTGGTSGSGGTDGDAAPTMPGGSPVNCVVRPAQTEGPYFTDFKLNRSDIRSDPTDGSVKGGAPLKVVIRVGQVEGPACKVWQGAMVDLWQCDAAGNYSDAGGPSTGKQFLRGYQLTDGSGVAEFQTIYPGYYTGRAVHLHFKIRMNGAAGGWDFTSQLYFPEAVNDEVFAQAPYASRGMGPRNDSDSIFRSGGADLIPRMSRSGPGWLGELDIGLRI
jgi:protocatechuate 3,4-dioxygenase beta subunit